MDDQSREEAPDEFMAPAKGSAEELLDAGADDPLDPMRHSAAHVMAEAVMDLFPGTRLGIGPAIDGGFYYDFEVPRPIATEDLASIEARMAESVAADHAFVRRELDPEAGRRFFEERGQPYKVEILDDLRAAAAEQGSPPPAVSTYEHGPFIDLCRGPHVASTGRLGPFKLLSVAGAYWRGDSQRTMLQRIYGTVWSTQEELDRYLELLGARELADGWTTSADVEATKPDPDLVRAALDRAGDADAEAVMVGDSTFDCEAAGRADVGSIGVLTGGFSSAELRESGAAAVYGSVEELVRRIDETPFGAQVSA